MKKRTLVCFLIFTLCLFHSSIPDTVFGQDDTSLVQQVYDKYSETLLREDLKDLVDQVLTALSDPETLKNPTIVALGGLGPALDLVLGSPALIRTVAPAVTDEQIGLLTNDQDIRALLMDSNVRTLLQNTEAVKALQGLLAAAPIDPTPPDPAPPTISITTLSPTTDQSGSFNVAFTTADVNGDAVTVTGSISVVPAEAASYYSIPSGTLTGVVRITQTAPTAAMPTIAGATVTLTLVANDGTANSSPATIAVTFATAELPPVDPGPPDPPDPVPPPDLTPSNLNGQSRLGGLSLNRVSGRAFIREIVKATGLPASSADPLVEPVVDFILAQIPQGILPKKAIRQILASEQPVSVFAEGKKSQLDFENFGNAITPSLVISDFADVFTGDFDVKKYLTSDNLNLYVRVPDALEGGNVKFNLNGRTVEAERITPVEFQQDTIPYTFRLDESLAATNLPAWPGSDTQIFSSVVLRYSQTGLNGDYIAVTMNPKGNGVWESDEIGILAKGNTFYYFEVTLTHPVKLEVINPEVLLQIAAAGTSTAPAVKEYIIENWSMPDPRNLQLAQRGIIDALFTPDLQAAMAALLASPEVRPLIEAAYAGQPVEGTAIANAIPRKEITKLQNMFFRNVFRLTSPFEGKPDENGVYRGGNFDPLLASVFSVPEVDIETDSFWFANIDSIADGASNLQAGVYNANDELVDQIMVDFEVDTTAPAADIVFGDGVANFGENVTGYRNKEDIYVATAPNTGAAYLNITSSSSDVGEGKGYLIYQIIALDANGKPDPADTWLPLTVKNSMVASDIWKIVRGQLEGQSDPTLQAAATLELDDVLPLLNAQLVQQFANPFLKPFGIKLTEEQSALLANLIGAAVQDLNLIPLTYDTSRVMMMPVQGENLDLLTGNFGIRAMGIDTLFNVGSYVAPTPLRVVLPEWDRTSVTAASLGDLNGDGDADEPYESGTIFRNATDVTLTVTVKERTVHPGTIMVEYEDADGNWQDIGKVDLAEGEHAAGTTFEVPWSVTDFDALVAAGDTVAVRTVTTNGLQLTDISTDRSDKFIINLDADVHPVDPKVLVVDVITGDTNPDSGAPRGDITLTGYAARRTFPATNSIRVDVSMDGETWIDVGAVEVMTDPEHGIDGAETALKMFKGNTLAAVYDADMLHIDETSSYIQWSLAIDTVASGLADSITKENLDAAHAASNKAGMTYVDLDGNRYMVRAYPVTSDGDDVDGVAEGDMFTEKFSLDNVDDVGPLGPTNIVATMTDAYEDTGVFIDHGDGTYTVGGLVDKYANDVKSPVVTFTISPTADPMTYAGVKLMTSLPKGATVKDANGELILPAEDTGAYVLEGSGPITVTVDVGTLMDEDELVHNDRYIEDVYIENPDEFIYNPKGEVFTFQAHAIAYDAAMNDQTHDRAESGEIIDTVDNKITVNVQNTYRPDPGVIAISVVNSDGMVNPDSGAPQGILTFDVYTYGITSAPTEGIRVEVRRKSTASGEWIDPTWERITGTAMPSEIVSVSEVPVTDLSDILTDAANAGIINTGVIGVLVGISEAEGESPASLMKWSYEVDTRKLALEDTDAPEGTIKLDDTINRGDGDSERDVSKDENRYVVRAYSLTPKNPVQVEYPKRDEYLERGGVEAFFSLDNDDDVPPLGPTNITDVADVAGSIAANEDGSYTVGGIVDDTVDSPVAIFSIEPTADPKTYVGGMIRLVRTAPDGTVTELPSADVTEGQITDDVGLLANGTYMYHALVADEFGNWQVQGENDMPSPVVTVHVLNFRVSDISDLTVTAVDGESPDRHVLQETIGELQGRFPLKESIAVSFNVNNGSLAVEDLTGILVDGHEVTFTAGSGAENAFSLMADKLSTLVDGWYTPEGRVTKRNGSVTFSLATINLDNTGPMIAVETPIEGHTVNDLPTLLAGFGDGDLGSGVSDGSGVSAADTAVVSLARLRPEEVVQDAVPIDVDQSMVEQDLDSVVYTRTDKLAAGAYQFTVQVADRLGNVGEQTVTFAIEGINPIVVITAPASGQTLDHSTEEITGFFTGGGEVNITKFTINGESVEPEKSDNEFTYTLPEKDADADGALDDGEYTVAVEVTDGSGLTAQTSLTFTVELPVPTVAIHSPHAGQVYDNGKPIIAGDFTGAEPIAVALSIDGVAVEAVANDNNQFTYTPTEELSDGAHTVVAVVTDANGRTAETSTDFTVDIPGPTVMIHVPAAGQMYDISRPAVTGEFSGVAMPVELSLTLNGAAVVAEVSDNEFMYTPTDALDDGEYTLVAVATDANGKTAEATAIFSIRLPVPTATIESPHAAQVYDNGKPIIAGDFTGAEPITVVLSVDGVAVEAVVNDNNQFTYTPADALDDGSHMVTVVVTDANGRTAETSTDFTVNIPGPAVMIHVPDAGQMYDISNPTIQGEYSGDAAAMPVKLSLMLNGEPVEAAESGNEFMYTLPAKDANADGALEDGEYTLVAVVTDDNGKTAEATAIFSVRLPVPTATIESPHAAQVYDDGKPIVAGSFSGAAPIAVELSIDGVAVEAAVNDNNQFTYTPAGALSDGAHTVTVKVTDANGRTAETSTDFTVDIPGPTVAILSPAAGQEYDHGMPVVRGEFGGETDIEFTLALDGETVEAMVEDNKFTYTPDPSLDDGEYILVAVATDANGKTAEATTIFSIRLPVPTVAVISPEAGQVYDHGKPVITGEFSGAAPIEVSLSIDGEAVEAEVNDNNQFTYTPADALSDGDHMIAVKVTDANGRMAETSSVFTVDIPGPTVMIHVPAAGQMYDISRPAVTGEFSGVAMPVELSLTLNGAAVVAEVSNGEFMYTPTDALDDGEYTLVAVATDANGKTAEATTIFSIRLPVPTVAVVSPEAGQVYDHGKPVITGEFSGAAPIEVSLSIDGTAVEAEVNDNNQFTYTPADALSDGDHMIAVKVTDANGRMAETSSVFTVDIPGPSVAIHVPAAGQMYDISRPTVTGEFSGVAMPVELSLTLNGAAVVAEVSDGEFMYTPADALDDGEYTLVAVATDANGKTAEATTIFSIRLPVPTVAVVSPEAGQVYDHGKPVITGEFSGAAPIEVSLSIDGTAVEAEVNDNNQFTYTPADALSDGDHMIAVKVTDANGRMAETSSVFTVDIPGPSVAIHVPAAGQMYDISRPTVTGEFSGVAMPVELSLTLNGAAVVAEVSDGEFMYTPADALDDGEYTLVAVATDANGKTAEATTIFSIRLPVPTVAVVSPEAGQVYDHGKPVITGEFSGAAPIEVSLSIDGTAVEAEVNDNNQFTYTPADALGDGDHMIAVKVTDANGRMAETSSVFTVDIPGPSVAIHSPASGQTYDHGKPVIRVEFSGMTDVEVTTFTVNGEDVAVEAEDNQFAYTPADALGTGEYVVFVEVTDANEKTAQATVVFNVKLDSTPPVISEVSPAGVVKLNKADILAENMAITISAVVLEEQSSISNMQYVINNGIPRSYPVQRATNKFEIIESFTPGTHTIKLIAASEGGTREFEWQFTLEVDEAAPVISSITPAGTIHAGLPIISASATDESGVENIAIVVMDSNGEEVKGETKNDDEDRTNTGITRLDFHPEAPLSEGTYAIEVRATDAFGNSSTAKGGFTIDFDTAAPIITSSSPHNGARLMYKHDEMARPLLSITFGDGETGVNPDSIRLVIESPKAGGGSQAQPINLTDEQMSATQVLYTPAAPAFPNGFAVPGQYTVTLEVSDNAHQEGNVSEENDGARKANMAVYQFSFFVEFADAPILMKPFNFPNPFKDNTRISFGLNRMSTVSIVIYDVTGRPVRTLRDNVIMNAGNYTGQNGIGWDGKTSGGEDLARGIYYCVIEVTDGFEPESATLKLALTR
ncbi:MAG: Ig-like domain-containing protein [Candidatus Poribacteria bacterium]|nr:Ig-like domain-containing protein [Candidatus Poribacteria bacterium]